MRLALLAGRVVMHDSVADFDLAATVHWQRT
jgi:hypothetical protein